MAKILKELSMEKIKYVMVGWFTITIDRFEVSNNFIEFFKGNEFIGNVCISNIINFKRLDNNTIHLEVKTL